MRPIIKLLRSISVMIALSMSPLYAAPPNENELVIDVRSSEEFASGHYPGALHIPFDQIASRINEVTQDRNQPIALYCQSGWRARVAQYTLNNMGYVNVTNYGGLDDLREE